MIFWEITNSFELGVFFQFQVCHEDSDSPSLTSRERASKNPERGHVSPLWPCCWIFMKIRDFHAAEASKSANSVCWRKSPPHRTPEVTRRDGLSSWSVIWLVEKVPRRVILYAPVAVLHQRWAGHRCAVGTLQSSIARQRTDGFSWNSHKFQAFLIAEPLVTARDSREFV